jgi:RimJ/RimL family protein N-acetyltransferase
VNTRDASTEVVSFRPLGHADLRALTRWLNAPHVYEWWGAARAEGNLGGAGAHAATIDDVRAEYGTGIDQPGSTAYFVIEADGAPVGMIQWYRLVDERDYAKEIGEPAEGTAGIDLLIGEATAVGRGLGPRVIDAFVRTVVFADDDVARCVAGPEVGNARSIRAFEKAGFRAQRDAVVEGEPEPERVMVRDREPTAGTSER